VIIRDKISPEIKCQGTINDIITAEFSTHMVHHIIRIVIDFKQQIALDWAWFNFPANTA